MSINPITGLPIKEIKESPKEIGEEIKDIVQETEDKWTNVQVDSQVLSLFMSCPRKYEYKFVRHLVPIAGVKSHFKRGLIVHDGMLTYWKERIKTGDYQIAVQKCLNSVKEALNGDVSFEMDYKANTLSSLLEFLKFIQTSSWIPLASEKYFKIKIYEDLALKLRIFITGRIDLIVRNPQLPILPVDLKTESQRWFHTQMSNQFKIYCLACDVNLLGVQRLGFQTTLEPKDKFKMELLPFDAQVLEEYRTVTLPYWVKQLMLCHEDNYFPMNSTSCIHGHFACEFSDKFDGGICNISTQVREQKLARYFVVGPEWDPSRVEDEHD